MRWLRFGVFLPPPLNSLHARLEVARAMGEFGSVLAPSPLLCPR